MESKCCNAEVIGIEYWGGSETPPGYRYDGVSEWQCKQCGKRYGRWTGKLLGDKELEPRYGEQYTEQSRKI